MPVNGIPSKMMSPASGRSCPQTQLNRVVLPAPFGPTSPTLSPGATSKVMAYTAWIPPKDLQTPWRRRSGSTSAIGTRRRHGARLQIFAFGLTREEQPLEPHGPSAFLVFEHSLGVLGVGERTEGEQHDGEARPAEARREVREELFDHEKADAGLNGAFDGVHARGDHQHDQDQREGGVPIVRRDMLLLNAVEHTADAGDRTRKCKDDDALPGRVDTE